jgi:hypothetical protein
MYGTNFTFNIQLANVFANINLLIHFLYILYGFLLREKTERKLYRVNLRGQSVQNSCPTYTHNPRTLYMYKYIARERAGRERKGRGKRDWQIEGII